jgi:hypothetical protein
MEGAARGMMTTIMTVMGACARGCCGEMLRWGTARVEERGGGGGHNFNDDERAGHAFAVKRNRNLKQDGGAGGGEGGGNRGADGGRGQRCGGGVGRGQASGRGKEDEAEGWRGYDETETRGGMKPAVVNRRRQQGGRL